MSFLAIWNTVWGIIGGLATAIATLLVLYPYAKPTLVRHFPKVFGSSQPDLASPPLVSSPTSVAGLQANLVEIRDTLRDDGLASEDRQMLMIDLQFETYNVLREMQSELRARVQRPRQ